MNLRTLHPWFKTVDSDDLTPQNLISSIFGRRVGFSRLILFLCHCIRNLPQNCAAPCPSGPRQIPCPPVPSLISQNCKRKCLLGIRIHSQFRRSHHRRRSQCRGELPHDDRIVRPASRHNHLIHPHQRHHKSLQRIHHRQRRKYRSRP